MKDPFKKVNEREDEIRQDAFFEGLRAGLWIAAITWIGGVLIGHWFW